MTTHAETEENEDQTELEEEEEEDQTQWRRRAALINAAASWPVAIVVGSGIVLGLNSINGPDGTPIATGHNAIRNYGTLILLGIVLAIFALAAAYDALRERRRR